VFVVAVIPDLKLLLIICLRKNYR